MSREQEDQIMRAALSYQQGLTAYAYGIIRDWGLAQDAFQEALIALHHKVKEVDVERLEAWLRRVVHHKAVDCVRKESNQTEAVERLSHIVAEFMHSRLDGPHYKSANEQVVALNECMQKLNDGARLLLNDFYGEKHSCVDLASRYQRSENALRLQLSRIRKGLKICVDGKMGRSEC